MKNRFSLISFMLIFLTSFIVGITSVILIRRMHMNEIYTSINNTSHIVSSFVESSDLDKSSFFKIATIFNKNINQRVTIYDSKGFPIADSKNNSAILEKKSILYKYNVFLKKKDKFIFSKDFEEQKIVLKLFTPLIKNKNGKYYFISVSENLESFNYFQKNIFFILLICIGVSILITIPFSICFNNKEIKIIEKTFDSMEEEILDRAYNLETIIENISEGIILIDSDGTILEINSFAKSILNYKPNLTSFYKYQILYDMKDSIEISLKQKQNINIDFKYNNIFYRCSIFFVKNSNSKIILVLENISKEKKLELSKKEFVANASHELKTPLTIISGFLETIFLKNYGTEEKLFYYLGIVESEVNRLKKLVTNLLSLSTIENSYMGNSKITQLSIPSFASKLKNTFDILSKRKNINISYFYKDVDTYILFPKQWLEIIISNIIDNAIKYSSEESSIKVYFEIKDNYLIIKVIDFGAGICNEDLERIFERFYRGDKSHSSKIEGTGLGLSIVKHMIDIIEGKIEVTSAVGEGSVFTIFIPIINNNS